MSRRSRRPDPTGRCTAADRPATAPPWLRIMLRPHRTPSLSRRRPRARPAIRMPQRWPGRPDFNRRPPVPQTGALPDCATPRGGESTTGVRVFWPSGRAVRPAPITQIGLRHEPYARPTASSGFHGPIDAANGSPGRPSRVTGAHFWAPYGAQGSPGRPSCAITLPARPDHADRSPSRTLCAARGLVWWRKAR